MKYLLELFTRENITFALACFGSLGTLISWVYHWITTRKNITLRLVGYGWNSKGLLIYIHLINNSFQTITINDISFNFEGNEHHCAPIPEKVLETVRRSGKEIIGQKEYYSMKLPLTLSPLCGDSGYLDFLFEKEILSPAPSTLTFVIRTNRGKAIQKTLPLDHPFD